MIRLAVISILISCSFSTYSQEKEQQVNEVNAAYNYSLKNGFENLTLAIDRTLIDQLQPNDLGEILQKLTGVQIKSYGSLGGLKTLSIRGLGSQHTTFVQDGFTIQNNQTGAMNLGLIETSTTEKVEVARGNNPDYLIPASAMISSNALLVTTNRSVAPRLPLEKRISAKFGSFGTIDNMIQVKTGSKKFYGGANLRFRYSHGGYGYQLQNETQVVSGYRKNNDYADLNGGLSLHYHPSSKHQLDFYFQNTQTDQGLPGAIILYNDYAKARLKTSNSQVKLSYQSNLNRIRFRLFANYSKDSLRYTDPNYLNAANYLESNYLNHTFNGGISSLLHLKKWMFQLGTEENYSTLNGFNSFTIQPERWTNNSFFNIRFNHNKTTITGQLGNQFLLDKRANESDKLKNYLLPFLEYKVKLSQKMIAYIYYRKSIRNPNFNELYFNGIGNSDLKVERADQLAFGLNRLFVSTEHTHLHVLFGAYYHQVNDKIIATPTKNLFTWSIQNIGRTEIFGYDITAQFEQIISKSWVIENSLNYTFQKALDITNRNSSTYRHQLAYFPEHIGNIDLGIHYRKNGVRLSYFMASNRYALNENIYNNIVEGYYTLDLALFYTSIFDKYNQLKFQLTLKNITNQNYSFIKNYIMPGRNFLISLHYAFK